MKKQPAFVFIHPDSSKIRKVHISIPKIIIGFIITILVIVGSIKLSVNLVIKLSHNHTGASVKADDGSNYCFACKNKQH